MPHWRWWHLTIPRWCSIIPHAPSDSEYTFYICSFWFVVVTFCYIPFCWYPFGIYFVVHFVVFVILVFDLFIILFCYIVHLQFVYCTFCYIVWSHITFIIVDLMLLFILLMLLFIIWYLWYCWCYCCYLSQLLVFVVSLILLHLTPFYLTFTDRPSHWQWYIVVPFVHLLLLFVMLLCCYYIVYFHLSPNPRLHCCLWYWYILICIYIVHFVDVYLFLLLFVFIWFVACYIDWYFVICCVHLCCDIQCGPFVVVHCILTVLIHCVYSVHYDIDVVGPDDDMTLMRYWWLYLFTLIDGSVIQLMMVTCDWLVVRLTWLTVTLLFGVMTLLCWKYLTQLVLTTMTLSIVTPVDIVDWPHWWLTVHLRYWPFPVRDIYIPLNLIHSITLWFDDDLILFHLLMLLMIPWWYHLAWYLVLCDICCCYIHSHCYRPYITLTPFVLCAICVLRICDCCGPLLFVCYLTFNTHSRPPHIYTHTHPTHILASSCWYPIWYCCLIHITFVVVHLLMLIVYFVLLFVVTICSHYSDHCYTHLLCDLQWYLFWCCCSHTFDITPHTWALTFPLVGGDIDQLSMTIETDTLLYDVIYFLWYSFIYLQYLCTLLCYIHCPFIVWYICCPITILLLMI